MKYNSIISSIVISKCAWWNSRSNDKNPKTSHIIYTKQTQALAEEYD